MLDGFLLHQNVLELSNISLECPETQLPDGPLAVELKPLELFVLNYNFSDFLLDVLLSSQKSPAAPRKSRSQQSASVVRTYYGWEEQR
jgi:hypothetical protein